MSPLKEGFRRSDLHLGWKGGATLSSHSGVTSPLSSTGDFQKGPRTGPHPYLSPLRKGLFMSLG